MLILLFAGAQQVQGFPEQHDRDAAERDQHEYALQLTLALEHELVAPLLGHGRREQHHVDEENED